ncbi:HET-domain-containing protein, partial [Rhizodiscina lignyota]
VSKWYEECTRNHLECNNLIAMDWQPTRLLDVQHSETSVRLWLRDDGVASSYMTLSHCWGGTLPLKLINSRIAEFRTGIEIQQLPRTFIEAVHVVRKLGARFLWIDALCIVQDSEDDWRQESQRMGKIYANSLLNIAATASRDGSGGLFRTRDPHVVEPCEFTRRWNDRKSEVTALCEKDLWIRDVEDAPLNRRSWVIQERFLAPRIIHFGETQLFWECKHYEACETFPDGLPVPGRQFDPFKADLEIHNPVFDGRGSSESKEIYRRLETWRGILKRYTTCGLSYERDKLVAISGVARNLTSDADNDMYVAGLWRDDIVSDLLWSTVGHDEKDRSGYHMAQSYRAPSWSWASIDASISY